MSFSLYRRPGGVVFLDDDWDYLEMLGKVMPPDWYVRLFLRPVACIDLLHQDIQSREADVWAQQEIISRWREGALLIPEILAYWRRDGMARFALTQLAVVDYAMPAMSGLQVLGELARWPGARILLTGRADEQLAVSAFNRGLINQFIPKQSPDIRLRLTTAINSLRARADERQQQAWGATLSPAQHALLGDPVVSQALQNILNRLGWVEHIVIGAPFGVLALNAQGAVSWLQLEPAGKLQKLADLALAQGWDMAAVQNIRMGSQLIDLELGLALGSSYSPRLREAWHLPGETGSVYAAVFTVDEAFGPGLSGSYSQFLAGLNERLLD